jgi:hypothetical protein
MSASNEIVEFGQMSALGCYILFRDVHVVLIQAAVGRCIELQLAGVMVTPSDQVVESRALVLKF